ncbi:hypothetical protein ACP70R_030757 [Stipagrostis hirtigluma subsp. patula]
MQQQARGRGEAGAAAPRPPPAWHHTSDRPFFRPPEPPASTRSVPPPRRPAESRGHRDAPDRPVPRPPDQPAPPPAAPRAQRAADRPLPPPPRAPPSPVPEPPAASSPEPHYAADRLLPPPPAGAYSYPPARHDGPQLPPPPRARRRSSAVASCLVAAAFLLLAAGGAGAALFLLFRPRPPDIAVAAVRLPSFAAANGTVAFTFEQTATVRNPNRSPLAHFDSSLRVAYAGGELGSVYIPAGLIAGGSAKDMSASFAVPAFPAATPDVVSVAASAQQQQPAAATAAPVIEVDSLLVVKGRVKVLHVLTHRVQAAKLCRVGVSPLDGQVLGFRC